MGGCVHALQEIAYKALELSIVDFGIPQSGGKRDAKEQFLLYKKGVSGCDGYKLKSYHQSGKALDFYAYVDGKASWDEKHLALIACAFLQAANALGFNLEWGGLWKSRVDMPHVQLKEQSDE
jgi:peptidoglycan L-alanyl-D-glutamate endopeptidase CwlK